MSKDTSVQDRINQITKAKSEAERQAGEMAEVNRGLQAQLATLASKVDALSQAPMQSAPQPTQVDPLAGLLQSHPSVPVVTAPSNGMPQFDPAALQKMVADSVNAAIAPVTSAFSSQAKATRLGQEFNALAAQHPQLQDKASPLFQAFQQVWNGKPELQEMDGGLDLAIAAAQGIVGSQPSTDNVAGKVAANTTPPTSPVSDVLGGVTDKQKAKQIADDLYAKGQTEGLTAAEWEGLLQADLGAKTPE